MFEWFKNIFAPRIVHKNIRVMTGRKEGQMIHKLGHESIGGNAGNFEGKPCFGANFWFNNEAGEIIEFTNDTAPANYKEGQFKVVLSYGSNITEFLRNPIARKYPEIIQTYYRDGASQQAKLTIALSVELYNQLGKKLVDHRKEK